MGQSSIPVLNRSGYSMFWASVWDDKHNFNRFFKEDYFIRKYIPTIFIDKISCRPLLMTKKFFSLNALHTLNNKYNLNVKNDTTVHSLSKYLIRLNKLPIYFSKIHILRFQKWMVIYFYIYSSKTKNKIILSKSKFKTPLFFKKYFLSQVYAKFLNINYTNRVEKFRL